MYDHQRFPEKINETIGQLEHTLRAQGVDVNQRVIEGTFTQEAFGDFKSGFQDQTHGLKAELSATLEEIDPQFKQEAYSQETSESMKAGIIAALASRNPGKYHSQALSISDDGLMSLESLQSGIGGELDYQSPDQFSLESFDETELSSFAAQNIMFNVLASRQDEFSEAFFPTKVITPSEGGISVTVDRQEVVNYATHSRDGRSLDLNRRNLIEAFRNSEILDHPATKLVPYTGQDGAKEYMIKEVELEGGDNIDMSRTITIGPESVETAPLKINERFNFMGLCQHPGLISNQVLDYTDQIAPGMKVSTVYMQIELDGEKRIIPFDVSKMSRVEFRKSHEGMGREVVLNFITDSLLVTSETKDIAQAEPFKGKVGDGYIVHLGLSINGNGILETGEVEVNASPVRVERVLNPNGEELSLAEGTGKDVKEKIAGAQVIGYDLDARRSNSNWRNTGPLIDVTPYTEKYAIYPGYPISVLTPTEESQHGQKISGMVNAARIRISNNAITTLENYAEQLDAVARGFFRSNPKTDILGTSRYIVQPFYAEEDIDVASRVLSMHTNERWQDVTFTLVNAIREMAYHMFLESNYVSALSLASGGTNTKPKVLIGTDIETERYLNPGDGNFHLFNNEMDYKIVSTMDERMEGKIYMTFTRERPGSEDGLSFGVHAYIPELIQRVTTQRQGATTRNDRVIPRSVHIPVLPILARLNVRNLREAIRQSSTD